MSDYTEDKSWPCECSCPRHRHDEYKHGCICGCRQYRPMDVVRIPGFKARRGGWEVYGLGNGAIRAGHLRLWSWNHPNPDEDLGSQHIRSKQDCDDLIALLTEVRERLP